MKKILNSHFILMGPVANLTVLNRSKYCWFNKAFNITWLIAAFQLSYNKKSVKKTWESPSRASAVELLFAVSCLEVLLLDSYFKVFEKAPVTTGGTCLFAV